MAIVVFLPQGLDRDANKRLAGFIRDRSGNHRSPPKGDLHIGHPLMLEQR